jgi:hypothetical protein
MISFAGTQLAFIGTQVFSAILAVIVLSSYHRQGQNMLLRIACISVLLTSFTIFAGYFYFYKTVLSTPAFLEQLAAAKGDFFQVFSNFNFGPPDQIAISQAILLNYLIISTHILLSLAIVNSCCQALGWRIFGPRDSSSFRSQFFSGFSLFVPLIPTVFLTICHEGISPIYLYYRVASNQLISTQTWIVVFSIPGILAGSVLFIKSLRIRTKSILMTKTTQITFWYMFRLGLAQTMLIILTVLGISPVRMSLISTFIPSLYGFIIFFMYGFGQPARKVYSEVWSFFTRSTSSRVSGSTYTSKNSRQSILGDEFAFEQKTSPIPIPDFPASPFYADSFASASSSPDIPRRGSAPPVNAANLNAKKQNRQNGPFMGNIREDFRGESL